MACETTVYLPKNVQNDQPNQQNKKTNNEHRLDSRRFKQPVVAADFGK